MQITVQTIAGKSKQNSDDSVVVSGNVFYETLTCIETETLQFVSICDGVGGNAGGKKASLFVSEKLATTSCDSMDECGLKSFFSKLNRELIDYAKTFPQEKNMATTCTALINSQLGFYLVHVGNCRLYKLQGIYLKQLSSDQTIHQLLKTCAVFEESDLTNKNEIYACMGGGSDDYCSSLVVKKLGDSYKNELLILTSDGIHDYLTEEELEQILINSDNDECATRNIIEMAREKGSSDDCSIVIIRS